MNEIKSSISKMINKIIKYEDLIYICPIILKQTSQNISNINENIDNLVSENKKETSLINQKISIYKKEMFDLESQISKIQKPNVKYTENDLKNFNLSNYEKINIQYNQNLDSIKENLLMMKEDKITTSNELIDYMTFRESLESYINNTE